MSRPCIQVETLHNYTIADLQEEANKTTSEYTRSLLLTVIMRYNGASTTLITQTLGKISLKKSRISLLIMNRMNTGFNRDHGQVVLLPNMLKITMARAGHLLCSEEF